MGKPVRKVAIVDYGMCNLDSVARAIELCGGRPEIVSQPDDLSKGDLLILPGVGAFASAMCALRERGFVQALAEHTLGRAKPLLGICLGMQLFASHGYEGETTEGLGWISGDVRRLRPQSVGERVPHVGWNDVSVLQQSPIFDGMSPEFSCYFVHSYALHCAQPNHEIARTNYCGGFTAAVRCGNIFGVQFHPEKSQRWGIRMLENFAAFVREVR